MALLLLLESMVVLLLLLVLLLILDALLTRKAWRCCCECVVVYGGWGRKMGCVCVQEEVEERRKTAIGFCWALPSWRGLVSVACAAVCVLLACE